MTIILFTSAVLRSLRTVRIGPNYIQIATITGRSTRGKPLELPKPFPYEEQKFRWYHEYMSSTLYNLSGENSKIIAVEGPIGVGKSAFCSLLAEQLDMLYIPQPTKDAFYILPSGYDLRELDDKLPVEARSYDHKNFCIDPYTWKAGYFQAEMMYLRFVQYADAMAHLLNTGQGVIVERSYYSDYVFRRAMAEQKYMSEEFAKAYDTIYENSSTFFIPPHLIIYLDIPVPVVQERIRTRSYCWEQNSPALTKEYLTSLQKYWKYHYLKNAREDSEILIYDWSDGGDIEVVIDDIEKIDFDIMRSDERFDKWWRSKKSYVNLRYMVTNQMMRFHNFFYYPWYKLDEVKFTCDMQLQKVELMQKIPECQYDVGYNPKFGDSILKILFSSKIEKHRKLRHFLVGINEYA